MFLTETFVRSVGRGVGRYEGGLEFESHIQHFVKKILHRSSGPVLVRSGPGRSYAGKIDSGPV